MSITYLEAIREAQAQALADDDRVFIYGQDVGVFGGAFKATKGLAKQFPGPRAGFAHQRGRGRSAWPSARPSKGCGPSSKCSSRIFPAWRSARSSTTPRRCIWRTQMPCPIVVRLPSGGTGGGGPFHSQSMEAIYAHYPGLIVMTPATVEDAYHMLLEAVAIDDPVIFCEHKYLYYHLKADAPADRRRPLCRLARRASPGRGGTPRS